MIEALCQFYKNYNPLPDTLFLRKFVQIIDQGCFPIEVFRLTVINELVPNDTYMHAYLISYLLNDPLSLNAANLKL